MWTKIGIPFEQNFLQINQEIYQSQVREIDFKNPKTPEIINNWVKDKTEGKIEKIIQKLEPEKSWCY
ncbi:MAG: hypothetical protein F6K34_26520 [Okeania sp. SIO4D6]|nr:hypothetical protein [Okeania sp. SIO4D6]